ncbi:MAG TPA: phosphoribosyltransferase [Verrucomicrobiae bacterium]|nr:phosphoribosyltransferase [Verrucomicrobiae bacterium]
MPELPASRNRGACVRDLALLLPDLESGGHFLAPHLAHYSSDPNTIVLALVRGGVPAAIAIASSLRLPIDVVLVRKLFAPDGPYLPVCAASVGGRTVLDRRLPTLAEKPKPGIKQFVEDALASLADRTQLCRGDCPPLDIRNRTVLLIDNGARTGGTIRASVDAMRQLAPAKIVVAIPVGSVECRAMLKNTADELICPAWHDRFGHVGMWYARYDVPALEEIQRLTNSVPRALAVERNSGRNTSAEIGSADKA